MALTAFVSACGGSGTPPAVSADVWGVVGDYQITRDEVERTYRGVVQPLAPPPSDEEILTLKLGIVDELITQQLLLARATALGIETTDAEVDAAFNERKSAVTEDEFQRQLSQRNLTADDIKRGLRRELITDKVIEREVMSKINVTDEDIADFYNRNRAQFNVPERQYRLAQILVTPVRDPQLRNRLNDDASTPEEARRKADMLTERLRTGADFAALAMDYSEDPQTVAQGGDLGYIAASQLNQVPPQLRDAVLKMEPGRVTTLSMGTAYTILMMVAREEPGQRDLSSEDVRDTIREMLRDRKAQLLRTSYVASARSNTRVVNNLAQLILDGQGKLPASGQ